MEKPRMIFLSIVITALLINIDAVAQDEDKSNKSNTINRLIVGPPGLNFIGNYSLGSTKDSPFSGEMVYESTQVLLDGNRIINKHSTLMYRDIQGRTRTETTYKNLQSFFVDSSETTEHKNIMIIDSVEGVQYILNIDNQTAQKISIAPLPPPPAPDQETTSKNSSNIKARLTRVAPSASINRFDFTPGSGLNVKSESLGTQIIEGISAEGSRTIHTIRAGAIGNERPIETISEHWYSQELQMTIVQKTIDPRSGESTQRLINISRGEPDSSLFKVPAGYTITQAPEPNIFRQLDNRVKKNSSINDNKQKNQ